MASQGPSLGVWWSGRSMSAGFGNVHSVLWCSAALRACVSSPCIQMRFGFYLFCRKQQFQLLSLICGSVLVTTSIRQVPLQDNYGHSKVWGMQFSTVFPDGELVPGRNSVHQSTLHYWEVPPCWSYYSQKAARTSLPARPCHFHNRSKSRNSLRFNSHLHTFFFQLRLQLIHWAARLYSHEVSHMSLRLTDFFFPFGQLHRRGCCMVYYFR